MPKFRVTVQSTVIRTYEVEAADEAAAITAIVGETPLDVEEFDRETTSVRPIVEREAEAA